MHRTTRATLAAVAIAASFVVPAAASAKTTKGVVVNITFKGQGIGHQALSFNGVDADPDTGCPALPPSGYTVDATTQWNATYRNVLLALSKATGELSSRKIPTSTGGLTGGSLSMSGTTPNYESGCLVAQPFTFGSTLTHVAGRDGKPLFTRNVGSDIFYLAGGLTDGITGSPASFTLPNSEGSPERIPALLPYYLPDFAQVLPKQTNKAALASFAGGAIEWNKLLRKLRSLRHRRTISFQAHGRWDKTFNNLGGNTDANGLVGDCGQAADASDRGHTTCTESVRGDFTITVRRVKLVTIVIQ
jgi:hypothetical protein